MTKGVTQRVAEAMANDDLDACLEALTEKQRNFVYEFQKDLNASRAAIRAGYKVSDNANKMGPQVRDNPGVKWCINKMQEERRHDMMVDANFVIQKILKSIERSEAKENEQSVLRGAELLARHLGMFVEKTEISGPDGDAIRMQQKVENDVRDFTSAISRLARRGKPGSVSEPTDAGSDSET